MKYQDKIATSRADRAMKFAFTGAKMGGNYIKYLVQKAFNPNLGKDGLHKQNAEELYKTLGNLKGSALKVAQMLSLDQGMLPQAYTDQFAMAQYSAPPLSGPLVVKTFTRSLGKSPQELFDKFSMEATHAASIGQVHEAWKDGKKLAVKIQYPGVADTIKSDLRLVKPIALQVLNLTAREIDKYMAEVEEKLMEETDYRLELRRARDIAEACGNIDSLQFPGMYPQFSSDKIITMEWLEGLHMNDFLKTEPSQEILDKIGQSLWNFYQHQLHQLKYVHADPHPGNFLFKNDGTVGIIDFGCVKEMPEVFYYDYFGLVIPELQANDTVMETIMRRMEMIYDTDSTQRRQLYKETFLQVIHLLALPFTTESFNFGDENYINTVYRLAEEMSSNKELRQGGDARGSKHLLYINRTMFGLYSMLNRLNAHINTGMGGWKEEVMRHHLG